MGKHIFYGWWIVAACFLISFYVGGVVFFGFTAFFEPIKGEFGWSYTQISFAASLRGLEMGILAPIIGFFLDRFGTRKLSLVGVITVGLGLVLLSSTHSLAQFYASFLLIALGAGGCATLVLMTAVAHWFHKNVGVALGVMMSGFGASGLIVPLIVRLIELYDWRITLMILGAGMWALGIPLSFVIHGKPEQYGYLPDGELSGEPIPTIVPKAEGGEMGFKEALKERSFLYLNLSEAIRLMILFAIITHVMPYLSDMGVPRYTAGLVAGAIPLFSIIGRFGFGWLADRFDKRHVLAWTFGFMGMGIFFFCYIHERWVIFPFLFLFSSGFGGGSVLRGAILREYFGRGSFGKLLGIVMGSAAAGGIIGPTLAGLAFDILGSYRLIWIAFCGLSVAAVGLVVRIR
jgi:MFS family permease